MSFHPTVPFLLLVLSTYHFSFTFHHHNLTPRSFLTYFHHFQLRVPLCFLPLPTPCVAPNYSMKTFLFPHWYTSKGHCTYYSPTHKSSESFSIYPLWHSLYTLFWNYVAFFDNRTHGVEGVCEQESQVLQNTLGRCSQLYIALLMCLYTYQDNSRIQANKLFPLLLKGWQEWVVHYNGGECVFLQFYVVKNFSILHANQWQAKVQMCYTAYLWSLRNYQSFQLACTLHTNLGRGRDGMKIMF